MNRPLLDWLAVLGEFAGLVVIICSVMVIAFAAAP